MRNKMTGNKINAEGASALSEALKVNTALKVLHLGCEKQNNNQKNGHRDYRNDENRQRDQW